MTEPIDKAALRRSFFRACLVDTLAVVACAAVVFGDGALVGAGIFHWGPWWTALATFGGLIAFALFMSALGALGVGRWQSLAQRIDALNENP